MKRIFIILLMLLAVFAAHAQENPDNAAYNGTVDFDGTFTLHFPENWQQLTPDEAQASEGIFAMFSDSVTFMTAAKTENADEFADTAAYCLHLQNAGWPDAFIYVFGSSENDPGTDFVLYSDLEAGKAMCATVIPGSGIYTFTIFPFAANAEAGQAILDILETCEPIPAE